MNDVNIRLGISPVGSPEYRLNRLRFHLLAYAIYRNAKLSGGTATFSIRCDDTNAQEVNYSFLDSYLKTLSGLGVSFDKTPYDTDELGYPIFQSKRGILYDIYLKKLEKKGLLLEDCTGAIFFNTEKFVELYTYLIDDFKIKVNDLIYKKLTLDIRDKTDRKNPNKTIAPFPIRRSNGSFLFNFCSPIDDGVMKITHLVRDKDKLSLLLRQEMIRISLGFPPINYIHAPILVDRSGKRFVYDEKMGNITFENFKKQGFSEEGLISYLLSGFCGNSEQYYSSIDEFASCLNLCKIQKSNVTFSMDVLLEHNKKALKSISDKSYIKQFQTYLKTSEKEKSYVWDKDLMRLFLSERRNFEGLKKIMVSVQQPSFNGDYDIPSLLSIEKKLRDNISNFQEAILNNASNISIQYNLSQKRFYELIRCVLLGQKDGPSLNKVVKYLKDKNLLEKRINSAYSYFVSDKHNLS